MPITSNNFEMLMQNIGVDFASQMNIAVAVSGGGDSLALAVLLSDWCGAHDIGLHAITVDHGLRPEAAAEAKYVAKTLKPFGVKHKTLVWEGDKPKTRIQEAARDARYRLMAEYCQSKKITYLFVAHHGNDQIETVLFRMAKGTGLDGLAGMHPVQETDNGLVLVRPLLSVSHDELLDTLRARKIDWIEDPSNENERYARVRIRNIIYVLEKEGLSPERMASLSSRLSSSIDVIDYFIDKEYRNITLYKDTERIEINYNGFLGVPDEAKTRILKQVIADLHPSKKYPARLEDIDRLVARMGPNFKGATLGGCIFKKKKDVLVVGIERSNF